MAWALLLQPFGQPARLLLFELCPDLAWERGFSRFNTRFALDNEAA
jgi:hypothetical protein